MLVSRLLVSPSKHGLEYSVRQWVPTPREINREANIISRPLEPRASVLSYMAQSLYVTLRRRCTRADFPNPDPVSRAEANTLR